MNHLFKIWTFCFFIASHAISSEAQSITDSVFAIEEVKVWSEISLNEKALNKTTINQSIIQSGHFDDMSSLLSQNSFLFIKSYGPGSMASVSFRGMSASHTRVEWNGIYLNNPMPGQVDFSLLPLFFADEIELLHGASSLYESSGALGGSVILKTIPDWKDSLQISLTQKAGSFHTHYSMLDIKGGRGKVQSRLRIFREKSKNDFPFYNTLNGDWNTQIQKNAGYFKSGLQHELYFRSEGEHIFSLSTWLQTADRDFPAIMSYEGAGRKENQVDTDLRLALQWKKYGSKIYSESLLGLNISDLEYKAGESSLGGDISLFDTENKYSSLVARNKIQFKLKEKWILRNLVDYIHHNVNSFDRNSLSGYENNRTSLGNSLSLHTDLSDKISAYSLIRTEWCDGKFIPLMPSLGMEITPFQEKKIVFAANLSRNFHLPGLNDLYWIPGGNIDLKPEKGYSSDISLDVKGRFGKFWEYHSQMNFYYSLVNDWIIWRPGEYGYWTAENIRKVASRGLEIQTTAAYSSGSFHSDFFLNYSFTKASSIDESITNAEVIGKQLMYVPRHKGNAFARVGWNSNYMLYNFSFTGKRFTTSNNEDYGNNLEAFALHGLTTGRSFSLNRFSADLNFKVRNLLDLNYQTILERAMPGRNYQFTLNLKF
ncbi:MAG: TonB-dependent receptor plug domain-containing protein [Bacteroidales bacterium]|nr:TonB-dependent receptor plug domain-containing protein [Bacteroidales bacterium]